MIKIFNSWAFRRYETEYISNVHSLITRHYDFITFLILTVKKKVPERQLHLPPVEVGEFFAPDHTLLTPNAKVQVNNKKK